MKSYINTLFVLVSIIIFSGCTSSQNRNLTLTDMDKLVNEKSQLQMRQLQTKRFYDTNKNELFKVIVSTMQDELYFITFINYDSGVISATGKKNGLDLNIVTSVESKEQSDFDLRISLTMVDKDKVSIINDGEIYQYLFDRLRKSLFLEKGLNKKETKRILKVKKEKEFNTGINYTIQLISAKNKLYAKQYFKRAQKYSDVTFNVLDNYFVVRIGKFDSLSKANIFLESVKKEFNGAIIVRLLKD